MSQGVKKKKVLAEPALGNALCTQVGGTSQRSEQNLKAARGEVSLLRHQADPEWGAQCTEYPWGTPGAAECTLP